MLNKKNISSQINNRLLNYRRMNQIIIYILISLSHLTLGKSIEKNNSSASDNVPNIFVTSSETPIRYSQPFNEISGFKPISPDISDPNQILRTLFTQDGKFRIFDDSFRLTNINNEELRPSKEKIHNDDYNNNPININEIVDKHSTKNKDEKKLDNNIKLNPIDELLRGNEMRNIENLLMNFIQDTLSKGSFDFFSEIFSIKSNSRGLKENIVNSSMKKLKRVKHEVKERIEQKSFDTFDKMIGKLYTQFSRNNNINVPRAVETGRLFFFKGLKKLLWPLFIGVQIAKSILLALFLPSILGSIGKIVGKGLTSVSGFNHPSETVSDFEFKDNYDFENGMDTKNGMDYNYPRPEASTNHFAMQLYDDMNGNLINKNSNALSRFGYGDQKMSYINTGMNSIHYKSPIANKNTYKEFLKVPSSSLLLSNYDPFYSPLLSRIDSVFGRLKLQKGDEACREKLICLMYSNPTKYVPYSNLISVQLSRELNELRKPTSDSLEILRFFKYMRAAKDGQDGLDCEKEYSACVNFKESNEPIMITTFNDINKLVQARKLR